jgi:hypothetical protein
MFIPEGDIVGACTKYGARAVLEAVFKRMAGDHGALASVGLLVAATVDDADRIGQVAYRSMSASERDAVIAELASQEHPVFAPTTLHGPL